MKPGRKPVEDRKVSQSISIRQSLLRKVRREGIDISTVVENALERALGRDPEEIEMERLEKEISSLKEILGLKIARYRQLKNSSGTKNEREEFP